MNSLPRRALAVVVLGLAAHALSPAEPVPPRFPGTDTSLAVNRSDGRIARISGTQLEVLPGLSGAATLALDLPGTDARVLEFRGNQVLYLTHGVRGLATVHVVIAADGRERVAWPNEGFADFFPGEGGRLTLDGKGVYAVLALAPQMREFFGLGDGYPLGAGVVASYRFSGEKLTTRVSAEFDAAVALTPDDFLATLRRGGALRYRAPGGKLWQQQSTCGEWRIVDVDPAAATMLVLDARGTLSARGLEHGELCWQADAAAWGGRTPADARLLRDGRVLALGVGAERWLAVWDPKLRAAVNVLPLLERAGLSTLAAFWRAHADSLVGFAEVGGGASTALMRAPEGWHLVTLP
jgi:hypothetical protein